MAQQAPVAPSPAFASTISRHSPSELAFQTPFKSQGSADLMIRNTASRPRMVSAELSGDENRFSRSHFTAPLWDTGGSCAATISLRTKEAVLLLISALLQLDCGVEGVHRRRDDQAEHEIDQHHQQHALKLAPR